MLFQTLFLLALVTTWAIEIPVLFGLIRFVFHNKQIPRNRIIFTGILCNALSLPYLWFVFPPYVNAAWYPLVGETFVIIVEIIFLIQILELKPKTAVMCSVIMNAASFVLGLYLL